MPQKEKKEEEKNLIKITKKPIIIQKIKKMNLKELKTMIAEEYSAYTEQAEPAVAVSGADVDVTGGDEDPEATLKDIYDMLKDYFEGDNAANDMKDADMDDAGMDDAGDDGEAAEALQERFKKLANIIKG